MPTIMNRPLLRSSLRFALACLILTIVGVGLVSVLTFMQGQRDEVRRADGLLLAYAAAPSPALLDHLVELYKRGYAPKVVLVGSDIATVRSALEREGLSDEVVLAIEGSSDALTNMRNAAKLAREQGMQSVLIADDPSYMLLQLKMARDLDLRAYGSPPPDSEAQLDDLLRLSFSYWGYVLLGQG
ncbi:MAG: hypothetical protein MUD01_02480 [Chloroflexaceae bacterium]|jgi:hypothetical protein|nr:hypothetical protein [Chloroflexaceae bacterium]